MDETTQTPATASNAKWLYIVIGVVGIALLGMLFMGRSIPTMFAPAGVDVDQNLDGTQTITTDEGTVTVGTGASMPANWPSDAPTAYRGATILYSGTTNPSTGEVGSAVSYTAQASIQEAITYYLDGLKAAGWTIESDAEMAGMRVIVGKKDTRTIGIYIADGGTGTVQVTAGVQM